MRHPSGLDSVHSFIFATSKTMKLRGSPCTRYADSLQVTYLTLSCSLRLSRDKLKMTQQEICRKSIAQDDTPCLTERVG
jgi:hypothetical protein